MSLFLDLESLRSLALELRGQARAGALDLSGECGDKDCSLSVSLRSCWLPLFPLP